MKSTTPKFCRESKSVMNGLVLPNDTNNHNSLFGGILLKKTDEIASISARRHCRTEVVTASIDSVDFLYPINPTDSICLESFVTWTGKTSMEVFVKAIKENLNNGERKIAATAFLTFVSLDKNGKPILVPKVTPETEEEIMLNITAEQRSTVRKERKKRSKELASYITTNRPWE